MEQEIETEVSKVQSSSVLIVEAMPAKKISVLEGYGELRSVRSSSHYRCSDPDQIRLSGKEERRLCEMRSRGSPAEC